MTRHFRKQGVIGPPYSLVSGSLHDIKTMMKDARNMVMDKHSNDITQRVLPHYQIWSSLYGNLFLFYIYICMILSYFLSNFSPCMHAGERFLYWYGIEPRICISDVELAKEILSNKFGFYAKPKTRPSIVTMIGEGLAIVNGVEWVRRRRILNPAFSMDKLKVKSLL